MIGRSKGFVGAFCGVLLVTFVSCNGSPEGWSPVFEQTSTGFLQTETENVAARVAEARAALDTEPEKASSALAQAEDSLQHLLTYYLPLLEARERSYNAYRHFILDETARTEAELDRVEAILLKVAEGGHGGHLLRELQEPLERLEDARASLDVDADEASQALISLATELNFFLLKGGLVMNE